MSLVLKVLRKNLQKEKGGKPAIENKVTENALAKAGLDLSNKVKSLVSKLYLFIYFNSKEIKTHQLDKPDKI